MAQTFTPTAYEIALRAWILAATGYPGEDVIYARQPEAPRPERPFITLQTINLVSIGSKPTLRISNTQVDPLPESTYEGELIRQRRGSCQVDVYADDHADVMACLVDSLHDPDVRVVINSGGLTILEPDSMINSTDVAGPEWELRSLAEFPFSFALKISKTLKAVERANATYTGLDGGK